ncbi:hypothetical protein CPB85DRAFT_885599 [Mucidula mucida]|nr:hypothetical protein CPB85DRAFT_885599 [Mucidula mucida]
MFTSQLDMQSAAHAVIQHLVDQSKNAVPSHIPPPMAPLNQMPTTSRPVKPCDTQRLHYIIGGKVVTPADFPDAEDMLREIFSIPFPAPLSFDSIADAAHLFRNQEHCDRPPYKNAELAALAIYTHERRMATLHEIREIVTRRYPSLRETSFKDSLRHLLSYDASFVKIPQTESNGGPRGGGDYWALNIELWGKKKRAKMRKRAPPKPKPEPCSRPIKRSAKSRKTDDLLKVEETSIHSPNIDEFVGESEGPRKRRRMARIKVEDLDTAGFDSSPCGYTIHGKPNRRHLLKCKCRTLYDFRCLPSLQLSGLSLPLRWRPSPKLWNYRR